MSASHELLQQVPFAMSMPKTGPMIVGAVGLGAAAGSIKRLTPHFHHTINEGEVGVWLKRGEPMLEEGFTQADVKKAEDAQQEDPDAPVVCHYQIVHPENGEGWRIVPFFKTLQTVYTSDQPAQIRTEVETADRPRQKLEVHSNLTWFISPDGDNPVRSLTRVKHVKHDKKDVDMSDAKDEAAIESPLIGRVKASSSSALGRVLSGRDAEYLYRLTYIGETEEEQRHYAAMREQISKMVISQCVRELGYYGVILKHVALLPTVRTPEEVQAQALRTLSPTDAAASASTNGRVATEAQAGDNVVRMDEAQRAANQ